jgi:plasmid stabilization system protein ParE
LKIIETHKYKSELRIISFYIKRDKKSASIKFVQQLKEHINKLNEFPFKYRQSIYFNNKDIRDMVFNGYTVIYKVYSKDNMIKVLTIFNQNKKVIKIDD